MTFSLLARISSSLVGASNRMLAADVKEGWVLIWGGRSFPCFSFQHLIYKLPILLTMLPIFPTTQVNFIIQKTEDINRKLYCKLLYSPLECNLAFQ